MGAGRREAAKLLPPSPNAGSIADTVATETRGYVRRSAFGVRRSAFGVRRSAFGVRRSAFGRSAFGVRRSAFGVRRSAFGVRRFIVSNERRPHVKGPLRARPCQSRQARLPALSSRVASHFPSVRD